MTPTLTLPGSIPGLLRRGSPVFWRDEETPYVVCWVGPWPDSDSVEDGAIVLAAPCSIPTLGIEDNFTNFSLDLTDPTGRAHAAWWLMSCRGWRRPFQIPGWEFRSTTDGVGFWFDRHVYCDVRPFLIAGSWIYVVVPSLADLDPADPRTLPDGSRWVDAEALRCVVLHFAGLEVTP